MRASVIICSRDRADNLARCLATIEADASVVEAEIIVVDNASGDRTAEVVVEAARTSKRMITRMWWPTIGKTRALNAAVRCAHGDVLVFTDDDTEVQPGWLDAIVAPFRDPRVAAVGGRVLPVFVGGRPEWMTDDGIFYPLTLQDYGDSPFCYEGARLPVGANMAIRRSLLGEDPFDPRLGHTGGVSMGFEEHYLLAPLARDYDVVYAPAARVHHVLPASLLTAAVARRKLFHVGFGDARYRRIRGEPVASLSRRVTRAARAWIRLFVPTTEPNRVRAWFWAGHQTEALVGPSSMRAADWLAAHLVRRQRGRG